MVAARIERGASEGGSNGRTDRVGHLESGNIPGYVCAKRGRARSALFLRVHINRYLSYVRSCYLLPDWQIMSIQCN